jgi:hypothetical protein
MFHVKHFRQKFAGEVLHPAAVHMLDIDITIWARTGD